MSVWWIVPVAGVTSLILTGLLRRYALSRRLIDVPNTRSSHSRPTPRGGGVAIVVSVIAALPVFAWQGVLPSAAFWALFGAGLCVAVIGFVDDHRHVRARWRLLAHFAAAVWALAWLGGAPPLVLPEPWGTGWLAAALATLYVVWLLNLYNFMDGIDGLAAVEAICVCVGAALLHVAHGHAGAAVLPLILATATAGFLYWNFPPARIFMGDAGSGFLGVMLGVLSLQAGWVAPELFWSWLILLAVFVTDATVTLLRRLFRAEPVYQAHRSHAYQHAARRAGHHRPVTMAVAALNLVWLLPLAVVVGTGRLASWVGIVLAYVPLVALALHFRAGVPEASGQGAG